jgi:hypothetical protein
LRFTCRRNILFHVGFEVLTKLTMKSAVLCVLNPCTSERALSDVHGVTAHKPTLHVKPGLYFAHRADFERYIRVLKRSPEVSARKFYALF